MPPASNRKRVLMALGYHDYQLHQGIVSFAKEAGWILDCSMAHYGTVPEHWKGDGVVALVFPGRRDLLDYLGRLSVPVVALSADCPELSCPRVLLDNQRIGRLGAEHLLERGFRHLVYYKYGGIQDVIDRERGFRDAATAAGAVYTCLDWFEASRHDQRLTWFDWLTVRLRELAPPVGIMAQSDNRALHLLAAAAAAGLAVPDQAAVLGVDNNRYACEFATIPISSVDSHRERLAYEGAARLARLMNGEPAPAAPLLIPPLGVVTRQSSDILAIAHPEVAKALKFIWSHFQEGITAEDVLSFCAMSRCGLYHAFNHHVGRPIAREILRKRLEKARRLLGESSERMQQIADACGFSSAEHFTRAFTRDTAISPSKYRRQCRR